ncbi:MAG TPA: crossover junction endodeoxyribonuclease RuvC [Bryobacteraceae bacterium]|nr:crossover junction endodeoxyribonuclease RuvC [Bryobacteraceae bacterium]HPT25566.1 crossover junction endodeoxyribonuclease RuvC [Bryobacteraceae bacterium]
MRILGIDCGSQITGYGVIDSDGTAHTLVSAGAIKTHAGDPLALRLLAIGRRLREVVDEFKPDEAAVEDTFHAANARSALKLTHVRGVALYVMAEAGLRVGEYAPAKIKATVVGHGRADKEQVAWMLKALLRLEGDFVTPDASDAVAVAVCHAVHRPMSANLEMSR